MSGWAGKEGCRAGQMVWDGAGDQVSGGRAAGCTWPPASPTAPTEVPSAASTRTTLSAETPVMSSGRRAGGWGGWGGRGRWEGGRAERGEGSHGGESVRQKTVGREGLGGRGGGQQEEMCERSRGGGASEGPTFRLLRNVLKRRRQERIARKDGNVVTVQHVVGRLAAAQVVVIHRG